MLAYDKQQTTNNKQQTTNNKQQTNEIITAVLRSLCEGSAKAV
jgi:hypothetical protein